MFAQFTTRYSTDQSVNWREFQVQTKKLVVTGPTRKQS